MYSLILPYANSIHSYVGELIKLKETFIDPLLHPFAPPSLPQLSETTTILDDDRTSFRRAASPAESLDHLPIAARFLSGTPAPGPSSTSTHTHHTRGETPRYKSHTPTIADADSYDSDDEDKFGGNSRRRGTPSGGRSPYGTAAQRRTGSGKVPVPFPARSHQSLPPQPRAAAASTHSLGRQSFVEPNEPDRKGAASALKRLQRRVGSGNTRGESPTGVNVTAQQLPEDLRICLEVLEEVILPGHLTLREGLQKRYEEQYPLVRSLADIFVAHVSSSFIRSSSGYLISNVIGSSVEYITRVRQVRVAPGARARAGGQSVIDRGIGETAPESGYSAVGAGLQGFAGTSIASPHQILVLCHARVRDENHHVLCALFAQRR